MSSRRLSYPPSPSAGTAAAPSIAPGQGDSRNLHIMFDPRTQTYYTARREPDTHGAVAALHMHNSNNSRSHTPRHSAPSLRSWLAAQLHNGHAKHNNNTASSSEASGRRALAGADFRFQTGNGGGRARKGGASAAAAAGSSSLSSLSSPPPGEDVVAGARMLLGLAQGDKRIPMFLRSIRLIQEDKQSRAQQQGAHQAADNNKPAAQSGSKKRKAAANSANTAARGLLRRRALPAQKAAVGGRGGRRKGNAPARNGTRNGTGGASRLALAPPPQLAGGKRARAGDLAP
jgi:hypothetical protein